MSVKEARRKNLRSLVDSKIKDGTFALQEDFADAVGIDKSYLSQMLMDPSQKGARGVSEAKARQVERMLDIQPGTLDRIENTTVRDILINTSDNLLESEVDSGDYITIPVFDVRAACGSGYSNQDELIKGGLAFKKSFLRRKGITTHANESGVIYSHGDSMHPNINHNDVVLIDRTITTLDAVTSGKIYAFIANRELRIKRIFKNINGSLRISSDNPDKTTFPDEVIPPEELSMIELKGAVKWRGGEI